MDTGQARNTHELLEHAPLGTGLNVITVAALVVSVVSFVSLPMWAAVVAVFAAGGALAAGVVIHVGARATQRERNDRHRRWLSTLPPTDLPDFRADLADREQAMAAARVDWLRPLGAAAALMVSAVLVPYELIGSHSPNLLVGPINTVWITATLVLGLFCLASAIIAALHDGDPTEPAGGGVRGSDGRGEPAGSRT